MLTKQSILRLVEQQSFPLLVRRVLDNGRSTDVRVRQLLTQPEIAVASGLGLALQRLCELSWQVDRPIEGVKDKLLVWLNQSDLFGARTIRSSSTRTASLPVYGGLAAAAVAVRGLHDFSQLRWQCFQPRQPNQRLKWMTIAGEWTLSRSGRGKVAGRSIDAAIERIVEIISTDADRTDPARVFEESIIHWQLRSIPTFVDLLDASAKLPRQTVFDTSERTSHEHADDVIAA